MSSLASYIQPVELEKKGQKQVKKKHLKKIEDVGLTDDKKSTEIRNGH